MPRVLLRRRASNFGLAYAIRVVRLVVLAGRKGGGAEIVTDGLTGYLVDPDGGVEKAVGVLRRAAVSFQQFDVMRAEARREIVRRFSLNACAERKLALYESLR